MSTSIAVYIGIGERNIGKIFAFADPFCLSDEIGTITGADGFERFKICNSVVNLPKLPDVAGISRRLKLGKALKIAQERIEAARVNKIQEASIHACN